MTAFERMVAMRYLRARRAEGKVSLIAGISLAGIALGVAALIVVLAVMNGLRQEILTQLMGFRGHLTVAGGPAGITGYDGLARRLAAIPGVVGVRPVVEQHVLATRRAGRRVVTLRGVPAADLAAIAGPRAAMGDGAVALSARLARGLGAGAGDDIVVVAPRVGERGMALAPRRRVLRVGSVLPRAAVPSGEALILMPLDGAQLLADRRGVATALEVDVAEPARPRAWSAPIAARLKGRYRVHDWRQTNAALVVALDVERMATFLIVSLIVLIAALNIVASLVMLVKDKGRDIAVLRTMGATRAMVMRIFLLSGASVGVAGTVLGLAVGLALAVNVEAIGGGLRGHGEAGPLAGEISFLANLPAKVDGTEVAAVAVVALVITLLATLYPSWRASRLDPVEALRHE